MSEELNIGRNITGNKELSLFTLLNTNSRYLCPKVNSFIDNFKEMYASLAIVTETWLKDGQELDNDIDDLLHGAGIGLIALNRKPGRHGVAHGGVAVAYRAAVMSMSRVKMDNPRRFEVLATVGTLAGFARKLVTVAVYIPPGYTARRGKQCMEHVAATIMEVKRRYREPFIVVTGNFNQWDISVHLEDFADISEVPVGHTRGTSCIDRVFTNFGDKVKARGTLDPLDVDPGERGEPSDHRVAYVRADIKRLEAFDWLTYSYMFYNVDSKASFGNWIKGHDWSHVMMQRSSNDKAVSYQTP